MTISSDSELVQFHEGCILVARPDAKGAWGIGWGHDIQAPLPDEAMPTCTQEQADAWLASDLGLARQRAAVEVGGALVWNFLGDVRRAVLTDMAYELGGVGLSLFKNMLMEVKAQRYIAAAEAGMQSLWAEQVPSRAKMDMNMMASGQWPIVS